jgi:predicted permease
MRRIAELLRQIMFRLRGARADAEMDEEMRLHMDLRAERARAQGLDPDAAAAAVRRRFGNPTRLREESRDVWGWTFVDGWLRDLREAAHTLLSSPGFTTTAVLSLALGIGANTAIFSLVNALLLRTLPVEDPRELVQLTLDGGDQAHLTNPIWEQIRDHQQAFAGTLAFSNATFDLAPSGETEPVEGLWVSAEFFRVLGVTPMRGRFFTPEDDRRGGSADGPVAVISHRLWELRYGSAEDAVGREIVLDRQPFRIIGVAPPWFTGLDTDRSFGVAIPLGAEPLLRQDGSWLDRRSTWWLRILGRLPSIEAAPAVADHLRALSPGVFRATVPTDWNDERQQDYLKQEITLMPAATGFSGTGGRYGTALYALLGIAGLVLLIACANIANLLLARASQRERELSMRMALGAGRARLIRRLLCESFALALAGAGAGLALALVGSRLLVGLIRTQSSALIVDLRPDVRVLGFTIGAALLTALLFGLTPALRATRIRLNDVLKEGARGASQSGRRMWLGKAIVAGQVALSLVLVAGAGLFAGTMRNLMREKLGFDPENVLAVQVNVENAGVPKEQRRELFDRLLARLRTAPGVASAAEALLTPLSGSAWNGSARPEGYEPPTRAEGNMFFNRVSPGYFATMGTALVMGRDFDARDVPGAPKVMIIDQASARRYWREENPIGKIIRVGGPGRSEPDVFEVVGVVEPIKYRRVTEDLASTGYYPAGQAGETWGEVYFIVRTAASANIADVVRETIAAANPAVSMSFRELDAQVSESMSQQRLVATLSLAFAGLALLLSIVGLYGVTAYTAARRRGEIGIRIALGAQPGSVVWLMVRDFTLVLAVGLGVGWAISLGLGGMVESLLFGVEPGDPRLLGLAALILAAVSALAAYIPARRASLLQPIAVLREE